LYNLERASDAATVLRPLEKQASMTLHVRHRRAIERHPPRLAGDPDSPVMTGCLVEGIMPAGLSGLPVAEDRRQAATWVKIYLTNPPVGTPVDQRNMLRAYYGVPRRAGRPRLPFHSLAAGSGSPPEGRFRSPGAFLWQVDPGHLLARGGIGPGDAADRMEAILNPMATNMATKGAAAKPN
jgi:hypothetical protein